MEALRGLDYGVSATCAGLRTCATCHVYLDAEWVEKLAPPQSDEREVLSDLAHYEPRFSRLSCQVDFTPELLGLRVTIAPEE